MIFLNCNSLGGITQKKKTEGIVQNRTVEHTMYQKQNLTQHLKVGHLNPLRS